MKTIFLIFSVISNLYAHPVHLSITNIDYSQKNNSYSVSIRLFADDFEQIINSNYNIESNLGKKDELKNIDYYITDYVSKNLVLKFNDKVIDSKNYNFESKEIKDISIWLTYNIKYKPKLTSCEITNKLMFDLYFDQKNMLIFTYNDNQKALEFNRKSPVSKFKL